MKMFILNEPLIEKLGQKNFELMKIFQERKDLIGDLQKNLINESKKVIQVNKNNYELNKKDAEIIQKCQRLETIFSNQISEAAKLLQKEKKELEHELITWVEKEKILLIDTQKNMESFYHSLIFMYLYGRLNKKKIYIFDKIDTFLAQNNKFEQELIKFNALKLLPDLMNTKVQSIKTNLQLKEELIEKTIFDETGESFNEFLSLKDKHHQNIKLLKTQIEEKEKLQQNIAEIEKEIQNYEQHTDPIWDQITSIAKNMLRK